MKRDLRAMTEKKYDLVVIGGGITGACVARDAALRGLSVALLEKQDFAGATTSASSKLIHGGLRYLQNLEVGLVRESLRERRIWSNTAPHLIDPITFLMPETSRGIKNRMVKAIGLTLYDWLAYDRNRLDDPAKSIPSHRKLSRKEVLKLEPGLDTPNLTGAAMFHDYQMYSPERLALECVLGAAAAGADVANYAEVDGFLLDERRVTGVRVRDAADSGAQPLLEISGRMTVNAAGPWADLLMGGLHRALTGKVGPARRLIRSKGIHLLTRAITMGHAIAVSSEHGHFFILPWRGHSILGTTDTIYKGDPDAVHVTEKDIVNFLAVVNKGYPAAKLCRADVLHFYCGLRPLVDTETESSMPEGDRAKGGGAEEPDSYTTSRAAEIVDHEAEGNIGGILTVIGGKWTTSRNLAEKVVGLAITKLGRAPVPCATESIPTYGGAVGRFSEFKSRAVQDHPDWPAAVVENLARNYGSRVEDVIALTKEDEKLKMRLSDRFLDIAAEVVYAAREEMALTVEDVLFRRTGLGTIGSPGEAAIKRVADLMGDELGWDAAKRAAQAGTAIAHFTSWARTKAIVNPNSWSKRTGALWPGIEAKIRHAVGPVEAVFTDSPMAATRLTAKALKEGIEQVIAIGGDGTVNEVVNGFFENGEPINPEAALAILTSGTGRDFRRTFGIPESVDDQIDRMAASEIRPIDVGKLTFINWEGREETRYFSNISSFGLSGATDREVNRLTFGKRFGGKFAFKWGMIKALLRYRNQPVRIQVDDVFDETLMVSTAAVCNGQYFGGGMWIAPNASPNDGLFDVVVVANLGLASLLWNVNSIYRGEHLTNKHVRVVRGKRVTALPVEGAGDVLLDVDGEAPGRLPATFEIMPGAMQFRS